MRSGSGERVPRIHICPVPPHPPLSWSNNEQFAKCSTPQRPDSSSSGPFCDVSRRTMAWCLC